MGLLLLVSGGAAVEAAHCSHAHSIETPTITQQHVLTPNDCLHSHSVANPKLTPPVTVNARWYNFYKRGQIWWRFWQDSSKFEQYIQPNNCTHGNTAESPTITQQNNLQPNDCFHNQGLELSSVAIEYNLQPNDCSHVHELESTVVSIELPLNDCSHSHNLESTVINVHLQLHNCSHNHSLGLSTITFYPRIFATDCLHINKVTLPQIIFVETWVDKSKTSDEIWDDFYSAARRP